MAMREACHQREDRCRDQSLLNGPDCHVIVTQFRLTSVPAQRKIQPTE